MDQDHRRLRRIREREMEMYDDDDEQPLLQEHQTISPIFAPHPRTTTTTTTIISNFDRILEKTGKDISVTEMNAHIKKIPNFLMKQYKSFQQLLYHLKPTTNDIEQLTKIALLIYKIMIIQTYHLLWTAYLKSGTGQLLHPVQRQPLYSLTLSIWPKQIKTMISLKNKNEVYLSFVNKHLLKLDRQLTNYQNQLNFKANHCSGYTLTIQNSIETYIEQHLQSFRLNIEHHIELLHYDYHIRALKLEYFRYHPNEYQKQQLKEICQTKYVQEMAEQESRLIKKQINYYNLSNQSTLIDSIRNMDIHQQLLNEYKEIAVQSRANLFQSYIKSIDDEREEYGKKFDDQIMKMWSHHRLGDDSNPKLPSIMIQLIDQRCQKITERLKCIYRFKSQLTP
ncbi:unnamed protein product [Adineta steineri]|uniref:Uncharacterized protein n=1 Tax=Adineta steineri TaxID=433720 RepID=A0A815KSB4_9BILA|nr:unnamed protein product [Adineta steineri]